MQPSSFVLTKDLHFTDAVFYGKAGDIITFTPPSKLVAHRGGELMRTFEFSKVSMLGFIKTGIFKPVEDTAAQAAYGYNTLTKSGTVHNTLSDALSTANFLGYLFRSPLQRVQSVTLLAETDNGSQNTALIDVPLDDVVTFKRTPPNADSAGSIDQNMIVESISRSFDAEAGTFHVTYTLDPYPIRS